MQRGMRGQRDGREMAEFFPDGNSALMLVAARLRHIAGTKWGMRQYLKRDRFEEEDRDLAA